MEELKNIEMCVCVCVCVCLLLSGGKYGPRWLSCWRHIYGEKGRKVNYYYY